MTHRLLSLLAVTLALGACNVRTPTASTPAARYASLDAALDSRASTTAGLPRIGPSERRASPVAEMPDWIGRPTRLRERDDAEAFEQAISLSLAPRGEPRENLIMVMAPRSGAALQRFTDGSAGFMGRPTEAGIRTELEAAFPGIAMQVVERPASNTYGPYGLAIGRNASGARCLYAWQWIDAAPAMQAGESGGPLSLRVRLCRSDITLEAMAASVNKLRLVPRFEGRPIGIAPVATAHPAVQLRRRTRHAHGAKRRVVAEHRAKPAQLVEAPAYRAATVAPPVLDGSSRRYLGAGPAPVTGSAPTYAAPMVPVAGVVRGALGGSAPIAPAATIIADLPPEAYNGPSSNPAR